MVRRWALDTGRQPSSPIKLSGGRKRMGLARSEPKQTTQHTHTHTNNTHRGHSDSDSSVTNRARRSDHRPSISLQPDGTLHSGVLFDLHPSARTEGAHTTYLPNRQPYSSLLQSPGVRIQRSPWLSKRGEKANKQRAIVFSRPPSRTQPAPCLSARPGPASRTRSSTSIIVAAERWGTKGGGVRV